jgi:hypothetical protein
MASLRFGLTNLIESATPQNGSGGAPALDEVSPWTMAMSKNRDRGMVWQMSSASPADCDYTLAATSSVALFAILGHRGAPSSAAGVSSVEVFTQTGAYASGGVWTSRGTITLGSGVRDGALAISPVAGVNSIRYRLTKASAATIGRVWASAVDLDLGIVSSPGYERTRIVQRIENRDGGGSATFTLYGDPRWEYSLPYEDHGSALFTKLLQVGSQSRTFLVLDRDDTPLEMFVRDGRFRHQLKYDAPDLHDSTLELESLP